jgi:hypothetical protein
MKIKFLSAVALAFSALSTQAATLTLPSQNTINYTVGGQVPFWDEGPNPDFLFALFDPSLGTLTDVAITINAYFDFGNVGLVNQNGDSANYGFTNELRVNTSAPGLNVTNSSVLCTVGGGANIQSATIAGNTSANSPNCPVDDPAPVTYRFSTAQIASLAPYIGVGTFALNATGTQIYIFGTNGNVTNNPNFGSGAQYTVEYTYTPANNGGGEIPEPSTVALIGAGLVGLATAARRRRS